MKVYVDADACPVTDIVISLCAEANLPCILLCDTSHQIERENAETIIVSKGADSADFKLANLIKHGDIAVTQDYGLAAMCLAKGAFVMHQDGWLYTAENIDSMLFSRHLSQKIRASGGRTKVPKKRTDQQDIAFKTAFKKLLESLQ